MHYAWPRTWYELYICHPARCCLRVLHYFSFLIRPQTERRTVHGRFTTLPFRHLDVSLPPWTIRYLDVLPPAWFATWTFRTFGRCDTWTFRYFPGRVWKFVICDTVRTSLSSGGETSREVAKRGNWKCGNGKCGTGIIAGVEKLENARVENAGADCRGGKCRSKPHW